MLEDKIKNLLTLRKKLQSSMLSLVEILYTTTTV